MECNSCVLEADASERNALESIRSPDGCKQLIAFEANFVCIQGHQSGRDFKIVKVGSQKLPECMCLEWCVLGLHIMLGSPVSVLLINSTVKKKKFFFFFFQSTTSTAL